MIKIGSGLTENIERMWQVSYRGNYVGLVKATALTAEAQALKMVTELNDNVVVDAALLSCDDTRHARFVHMM